jgi:hypothetical protein
VRPRAPRPSPSGLPADLAAGPDPRTWGDGSGSRPLPAEWCSTVRVRLCGSDHAVISSGVATPSCGACVVSRAMVASAR